MVLERVDFYVLNQADDPRRMEVACRLAAKAWRQGWRVFMQVDTPSEAEVLDDLLWQYPPAGFVPHARIGAPEAAVSPVLVGDSPALAEGYPMLVSLTRAVPDGVSSCRRVADLIADSEAHRIAGRERFRTYCALGIRPQTHQIPL